MIKKIVAAGLAGATLGTALMIGSAAAQDAPPKPRDPMTRGDTNGDGVVTREEMLGNVDKHFAAMDANKDGKIGVGEGRPGRRGGSAIGGRLARIDTDKDGTISLAEQRAQATRRFDYVDRNHDGKIDQAEREALAEATMGMGGRGHHGMRGHRGAPPPTGPHSE